MRIFNWFVHLTQRIFSSDVYYPIEGQITSLATGVIFTRSMRTNEPICLKVWLPCNNELYSTNNEEKCIEYLIEGLNFNKRFAPRVYLGIASAEKPNKKSIRRGRLIERPKRKALKPGTQYALVMRRLKETWHLDHQLISGQIREQADIEFLASEVMRMHKMLEASPKNMGTTEHIYTKLKLNVALFEQALSQLASEAFDVSKYQLITQQMEDAYRQCIEYFVQRHETGHIKRCHGDLKAANLWIRPEKHLFFGLTKIPRRLLALDCVDFNPSFCHIDTLGDIAMLAVDIEVHLISQVAENIRAKTGKEPSQYLLEAYLEKIGEEGTKTIWALLEYYLTEKAMICAYMSILYDKLPDLDKSILYDKLPDLDKRYLDIALIHAQRLKDLLYARSSSGSDDSRELEPVGVF